MFAVMQFPIADGRRFVDGANPSGAAPRPRRPDSKQLNWGPPPDYLRYFGRVVERQQGKRSAWTDDRAYFRADRAVRFVDLHHNPLAAEPVSHYAALHSEDAAHRRRDDYAGVSPQEPRA
jgi:hypothetical protein